MIMVYLNGQFLAPDGAIEHSDQDFYFKKDRLHFEFMLKRGDIVAVVRTFLGITWSRKFYRLANAYQLAPADTPLTLCRHGSMIPEGILTDQEQEDARKREDARKGEGDDKYLVA